MKNRALLKDLAACASAETLLAAILAHHPGLQAPIDVEAIARSTGITDFGDCDEPGTACALSADAARTRGTVLAAAGTSAQRRRFAVAHQLGHFLLKAHQGDRRCTNRDLAEQRRDTAHRKEEMQANRFAAGLLMPKPLLLAFVGGLGKDAAAKPLVQHLPAIAAAFDVTLEAAASRYADLTQAMCALVFVKDGTVRIVRPSRAFPQLGVKPGDPCPRAVKPGKPDDHIIGRIAWAPADTRDWLVLARDARPPALAMQVLNKANGFQLVLLFVNAAAERRADEEAEKDATERPKFGRQTQRS